MKHLLALGYTGLFCMICCCTLIAQPGMYTEADIEYQTIFLEAQHAKVIGDTDEQIKLLKTILKRDKSSHAAHFELARTYSLLGEDEQAQKNAEKAHKLDPKNEWYLLTLAEIYEGGDQVSAAVDTYNKLKTVNPENPTIYHKLAQLQLRNKNVDAAVANLETLQAKQGVDEESSRRIFDIHKTSGNEKKAIATLEKLINAFPDNTRYLGNLASYYGEIGKEKQALKVYEKILQLDPTDSKALRVITKSEGSNNLGSITNLLSSPNLSLDEKIQELMPFVSTMKQQGETTAELDAISNQLVTEYPEDAKVHALRADILYYQGKYEAAENTYAKALSIDDSKYALWLQYLQSLWELEKYPQLVKYSEEAIDLFPNQVNSFLYHGLGLAKTNKKGAEDFLMEAGFIAGKNELLLTKIKVVSTWLNKTATNETSVKEIAIKTLNEPLYLELAGDLYAAIKDNNTANKLWQEAIKLGSKKERINSKLGLEEE